MYSGYSTLDLKARELDRVFKLSGLLSMPKATKVVEKLASACDLGKMLTISNQITCSCKRISANIWKIFILGTTK